MHVMFRMPQLAGMLLIAATPLAGAESPMPDPIAPAVIGRPLDQIRPARPVRQKPAAAKPNRPKQLAAGSKAAPAKPSVAPVAPVAAAVPQAPAPQRVAKQALDDRADPRTQVVNDVGKGTRFASKPLGPGVYFSSMHQTLVRRYYQAHPAAGAGGKWRIGEPIPPKAAVTGVPDDVRAALPRVPPGHQYVQLDGEVVLVALPSRMVVDGISRSAR